MKNIFFTIIVLVLTVISVSAQIQTSAAKETVSNEASIKALFATTDGLIDATKSDRSARAAQSDVQSKNNGFGPGDHPVFILKSSHEFIRAGETLELSLIPMFTANRRKFNINIKVLKPGDNGEYDGTQPPRYYSADNGNYGYVDGIEVFRPVKLCSRLFTGEDTLGRHIFSIAAWDDRGRLVQQIIVDIYLVNAGHYGRFFYIKTTQSAYATLSLTGRFPFGIPIYYYVGTPDAGAVIIGPDPQYAAYSNGTELILPVGLGFNRTTSSDIMLWSPYTRYAMVKPHAWADDVLIQ